MHLHVQAAATGGKKARRKGHSSKYGIFRTHKADLDTSPTDRDTPAADKHASLPGKKQLSNSAIQVALPGVAEDTAETGRSVKPRITRADGTTAIGHMEVSKVLKTMSKLV